MKKSQMIILALFFFRCAADAQNVGNNSGVRWKPQNDEVYLQEISVRIPTESPVVSIAEANGVCLALMDGKVYRVENETLKQDASAPSGIRSLKSENNEIWALSGNGLYVFRNSKWEKIDDRVFVDLCMHLGNVHAATREDIFCVENGKLITTKPADGYYGSDITMVMEDGTQMLADPVDLGPVTRIESYSGTLHVLRHGRLVLFDGKTVNPDFVEWGRLPSTNTNDMISFGNRMYIGTDRGLAELRSTAITTITGSDGLPVEHTTCLKKGFDSDLWIGTARGAVRMTKDEFHYFGAEMWLPHSKVNDIAVGQNMVYVATDGGVGIIRYEPFTLLKKAAWFERHINEWGHKRLGFIHLLYRRNNEWIREVSDNDGGHTAPYLVAMCYKYAVTGDPAARAEAVESFKSMIWLNQITGKDGFIARSIWSASGDRDERGRHGSGGLPAKWYPTSDGKWFWKGDTSSDEVTSHFYAVSIFHDLVAEGKEKEVAREHLRRMASYIIDCGWTMHDMDGKPTRWARWNPEYLLRPYGQWDRGLNALEVLSYMEAAIAATGEQKFKDGYRQLINWGYPENTIHQKNTFPPNDIAPWDDDLAFMSYHTLLRYATDPILRSIYLRSLERSWTVKRIEKIPWYNVSYGALTGNECDLEHAMKFFREWSLDCQAHSYSNSHRNDLFIEKGFTSYDGWVKILSPRDAFTEGGSKSINEFDGYNRGNRVKEPTHFLRDYWMARYFGLIKAPQTNDPDLISVPKRTGEKFGAEPYNGTARPKIY